MSGSRASWIAQARVKTAFRILASLFLVTIGYESMVGAFHLLNLPSDRAVYEGTAMLILLVVLLPFLIVRLWRSS
jgi:hypothetical protein